MNKEDIDKAKIRLDSERLELEKVRLQMERSFWKKYLTPFIGIIGVIIAGLFSITQVWVASIQKDKEIASTKILKERELEVARIDQERQWKLDISDFVFRNREAIFSSQNEEQRRIIKVIAVTFPSEYSSILFDNLKAAVPEQQKIFLEEGQQLVESIRINSQEKLYYVIAMTSSKRKDIEDEINRIKRQLGGDFKILFPNIDIYAPEGGPYTLLISGKAKPYTVANELKYKAIKAGFSKDTWLWKSSVRYFSSKSTDK